MTILWILLIVAGAVCFSACWLYDSSKPAVDAYKRMTKKTP